jgi:hypothetical protein
MTHGGCRELREKAERWRRLALWFNDQDRLSIEALAEELEREANVSPGGVGDGDPQSESPFRRKK